MKNKANRRKVNGCETSDKESLKSLVTFTAGPSSTFMLGLLDGWDGWDDGCTIEGPTAAGAFFHPAVYEGTSNGDGTAPAFE